MMANLQKGWRREGRTSRKTRLQQRRQKNGDAKPTNDLDKFYTVRAGERKRETPGKGAFSLSLAVEKKGDRERGYRNRCPKNGEFRHARERYLPCSLINKWLSCEWAG